MTRIDHRRFLKRVGSSVAAAATTPSIIRSGSLRAAGRVAVVGGGFGGATAAKYLRLWSDRTIQVRLISREATYSPPVLSNLILNNRLPLNALTQDYQALAARYGIQVSTGYAVTSADIAAGRDGRFRIEGVGDRDGFDRVILAPGIGFAPMPFAREATAAQRQSVLHAWTAGPETSALRTQLREIPRDGIFVLTIPAAPFRAPPAAYERVCIVADYLSAKAPKARVIILDANPAAPGQPETSAITAETETFAQAFDALYVRSLTYHANRVLQEIGFIRTGNRLIKRIRVHLTDPSTGGMLGEEFYLADVLNVIPPQRAGDLVRAAFEGALVTPAPGIAEEAWALVDPQSYESTRIAGLHIVGDSQSTSHPKSAHMANAEAKICADAIIRSFGRMPTGESANGGYGACLSAIDTRELPAPEPGSGLRRSGIRAPSPAPQDNAPDDPHAQSEGRGASPGRQYSRYRSENDFESRFDWAYSLFADSFG